MPPVSVREIARNLSLSPGTVSKALRGSVGMVSLETAEQVLNYCHLNGYMSKVEAGRILFKMKSRSTGKQLFTVTCRRGVMMYDVLFGSICEQLQSNDLYPSSFLVNGTDAMQRFPYERAGVAIILGRVAVDVIDHFTNADVPMVLVDNRIANKPASAVNSNNLEAVSQAVEILFERGHRRIAFMCNHEDIRSQTYTFHQRQTGYLAGLAKMGLPVNDSLLILRQSGDYDAEVFDWESCMRDLRQLAEQVVQLDPLPTAVITVNDMHAYVLREVLKKHGLKVPQDISLIGYDGQHHLSAGNHIAYPPVSTMAVPWEKMGQEAVDLALDLLCDAQQGPRYLEVPTTFEDVGTVAGPATG